MYFAVLCCKVGMNYAAGGGCVAAGVFCCPGFLGCVEGEGLDPACSCPVKTVLNITCLYNPPTESEQYYLLYPSASFVTYQFHLL